MTREKAMAKSAGLKWWSNKNSALSLLLALTVFVCVWASIPPSVDSVVTLRILKNRAPVRDIRQPRNIESSQEVVVDRLDLWHDNRLNHPVLGELGYGENFFVDINHTIKVHEAGRYIFTVGTDDGFSVTVDGKRLCEHRGDRPYKKQTCATQLKKGEHPVRLSYFQGTGNSGLTVEYRKSGDREIYFFGQNSPFMTFD